jgi:7,8-dihydropterin-6-yl-methyl-4-(beta-D-ribofuranosyl)aminobenzene 5'-phosphate synthase
MALVCETSRGLIVLTGCAHAGVVNIAEFARKIGKGAKVYAILGGLHLMSASDQNLQWTAGRLKDAGVQLLLGTHCTGVESCYRLREYMGGRRGEVVVGATGATFSLAGGLNPGVLSR